MITLIYLILAPIFLASSPCVKCKSSKVWVPRKTEEAFKHRVYTKNNNKLVLTILDSGTDTIIPKRFMLASNDTNLTITMNLKETVAYVDYSKTREKLELRITDNDQNCVQFSPKKKYRFATLHKDKYNRWSLVYSNFPKVEE